MSCTPCSSWAAGEDGVQESGSWHSPRAPSPAPRTCSAFRVSSMKICCSFSFTKLMQNCSKPFFCVRDGRENGAELFSAPLAHGGDPNQQCLDPSWGHPTQVLSLQWEQGRTFPGGLPQPSPAPLTWNISKP